MNTEQILSAVEAEIARLQQVANLLRGDGRSSKRQGAGKRTLSQAARNKIAAAQRRRWAKVRKEKKSA